MHLVRPTTNGGEPMTATVAVDPFATERKRPLNAILRDHPETGDVHPSSARRWALSGARAADGTSVRLEVRRIGSRLMTSREALDRFLARLNGQPVGETEPASRTPSKRQRECDRAHRAATAKGI